MVLVEGWEQNRSKCTYIMKHLDLFCFHPSFVYLKICYFAWFFIYFMSQFVWLSHVYSKRWNYLRGDIFTRSLCCEFIIARMGFIFYILWSTCKFSMHLPATSQIYIFANSDLIFKTRKFLFTNSKTFIVWLVWCDRSIFIYWKRCVFIVDFVWFVLQQGMIL